MSPADATILESSSVRRTARWLLARAQVSTFLRRWFDAKGFIEVQPASLQVSPGNETHLHGFKTALIRPDGSSHEAYLHTSPEFAMKKLLTAGERQIFALTNVFRNRERTALHCARVCHAGVVSSRRAVGEPH